MSCPPPALAVHTGQSVIHDPLNSRDMMVYHYVPNDAEVGGLSYLETVVAGLKLYTKRALDHEF